MNEENHMGWKLVSGVRRDAINLFKLFADTDSVRYEDFCTVWKKMKFSLIFSNRTTIIEYLEFTEELFQIIKEFLSSVYEFHTRVGALYTLYGLYFKQPVRGAVKIRVTKAEWQDLRSLIENSKSAQHYDVVFIFAKLYLHGAFSFTATKRPAGLERGYRKYFEKRNALISKACDVELMYRPLVNNQLITSFTKLESLYCRKKSELLGKKNIVFIDGSFAKSLQKELQDYAFKAQSIQTVKNKQPLAHTGKTDKNDSVQESSHAGAPESKKAKTSSLKSPGVSKDAVKSNTDENEELSNKKEKYGKAHLQLLAKRKAQLYLKKLQRSSSEDFEKQLFNLEELLKSEADES